MLTATSLDPPVTWQPLATNLADANGNCAFADTNTATRSARYYRAALQW